MRSDFNLRRKKHTAPTSQFENSNSVWTLDTGHTYTIYESNLIPILTKIAISYSKSPFKRLISNSLPFKTVNQIDSRMQMDRSFEMQTHYKCCECVMRAYSADIFSWQRSNLDLNSRNKCFHPFPLTTHNCHIVLHYHDYLKTVFFFGMRENCV